MSSAIMRCGSKNARCAVENETSCFLLFSSSFFSSHSNLAFFTNIRYQRSYRTSNTYIWLRLWLFDRFSPDSNHQRFSVFFITVADFPRSIAKRCAGIHQLRIPGDNVSQRVCFGMMPASMFQRWPCCKYRSASSVLKIRSLLRIAPTVRVRSCNHRSTFK
jgi:hypothetical protein